MKRLLSILNTFLLLVIAAAFGFACTNLVGIYVMQGIRDTERVQEKITLAQAYSQPVVAALADTCQANERLIERERAASQVVAGLREESTRLKASLQEAVETLKTLTAQNNDLMEKNEVSARRIDELQSIVTDLRAAIKALQPEPKPADPVQ